MWTKLCLFCQGPDSSVWGSGHFGEAGVKREPATFTIFGQGQSDDGCLEGQLKSVFILREVLNVERGKLEEYLGGGDGGNPGEWFGVCNECGEIVEECWRIWREIGKWRRKLEGKKRELRGKVEETGRRLEGDLGEILGNLGGAADQVPELDENLTCQQFLCSDDEEDEAGSGFDNDGGSSSDEYQTMSGMPTSEDGVTSTDTSTVFRKKYRCPKCIASYAKLRFLTDHLKIHKLSPKEIECCDRCGWAYKAPIYVLHRSEQCPFPNKLYQCSQCPAAYPFKGRYEKHLWLHQNKELGKAKECPKCGWLFSRKIDKFHVATHQNTDFGVSHESWKERRYVPKLMKEEIPWYCDYCHLIFPTRAKLARHVLQGHPTEKLVECDLCLPNVLRFESQKLLQLHKKEVHGVGGECKEERETLEGDEGGCPHCEKSFTTKSKRDYHLAKEHMKEQLICPICKKYRAREYHRLRIHMKTHEVSGVLTCEVCSKKIRRSLLPKHMLQMHCGRKRPRVKKQKSKMVVQVISTTPVSLAEQDNSLFAEDGHRSLGLEDTILGDDELPVVEMETDDRLSDPDWEPTADYEVPSPVPPKAVERGLLSPVFEDLPEKMTLNTPSTESFEDDLRAAETQLAEIISEKLYPKRLEENSNASSA